MNKSFHSFQARPHWFETEYFLQLHASCFVYVWCLGKLCQESTRRCQLGSSLGLCRSRHRQPSLLQVTVSLQGKGGAIMNSPVSRDGTWVPMSEMMKGFTLERFIFNYVYSYVFECGCIHMNTVSIETRRGRTSDPRCWNYRWLGEALLGCWKPHLGPL